MPRADDSSEFGLSRARLLAVILVVPVVGLLAGRALIAYGEAGHSSYVVLADVSLFTGIAGVVLAGAIAAAGALAASSRERLLLLFRPGLYLTAAWLVVLVLLHAAILIAVVYLLFRAQGFVLSIGLGAVLGVVAMVKGLFTLVRRGEVRVFGVRVLPEDAPRLWDRINGTANQIGALRPENIVVGLDPNFFVTELDVKCESGPLSGRTLFCSLPLARILDTEEFVSVIGHELGHFKGADTRFSEKFYPIYSGTASALESVTSAHRGGMQQIAQLPAIAVLAYFMETFHTAERRMSRTRELAADAVGASVTSPRVTASALVKVHAFAPLWPLVQKNIVFGIRERRMFLNLSQLYAEGARRVSSPKLLEGLAQTHLAHPTDSHPPLQARLEALGVPIDRVAAQGLTTEVADPAVALIEGADRLDRRLSVAYQELFAQRLGVNLQSLPHSREDDEPGRTAKRRRQRRMDSSRKRRP
jgi:Zn-dependent protease with chaperone function